MTPYYQDSAVTIYHGDCREIAVEAQAVVSDPPYGIAFDFARKGKRKGNLTWGRDGQPISNDKAPITIVGDASPFDPAQWLGYETVILWGANNYADKLPPSRSWLIWDKRKDKACDNHGDAELAWTNISGVIRMHRQIWRGIVREGEENVTNGPKLHPSQKPIELMRWCLGFVPPKQTILDPYIGSGTTLRAAKDLGRKAVGIEIEERYCEIAARRMQQEVLPLGL